MLSVGRELKICDEHVLCQSCSWEGAGLDLSTGFALIDPTPIYHFVYRCPQCGSFDLNRKGKLLHFRLREQGAQHSGEAISSKAERRS